MSQNVSELSVNWATLWEALADERPNDIAVVLGDSEIKWGELDKRSAQLASVFSQRGIGAGSKVAQLLFNDAAYIESIYALFKLRATPVNINYRYLQGEIAYILNNSESEILIYHASLAERLVGIEDLVPTLKTLICVNDVGPEFVVQEGHLQYEKVLANALPAQRIERSGEDLLFLYTGGTTGMPKGVMWRHVDLFGALAFSGYHALGLPIPTTVQQVGQTAAQLALEKKSPTNLCAAPLMHGVALFLAMSSFVLGGKVILLKSRKFDPKELLDLSQKYSVTQLSIVGDAFCKPITRYLQTLAEQNQALPRLESIIRITSSGATFSGDQKSLLQKYMPNATIIDMLGASEGGPFGIAMTAPNEDPIATAVFIAPPNATTFNDETWEPLPRGSTVPGVLGVSGPMPQGYYRDEAKTAQTFKEINGVRYTIPGDYALIDAQGVMQLLGRGSVCINSGGEKIYPEEVEVVARSIAGIADCTVVGVPDDRFGNAVTAVVSRTPGSSVTAEELLTEMRKTLAAYKCPRHVVFVDAVYRSPSGKADYNITRDIAISLLKI